MNIYSALAFTTNGHKKKSLDCRKFVQSDVTKCRLNCKVKRQMDIFEINRTNFLFIFFSALPRVVNYWKAILFSVCTFRCKIHSRRCNPLFQHFSRFYTFHSTKSELKFIVLNAKCKFSSSLWSACVCVGRCVFNTFSQKKIEASALPWSDAYCRRHRKIHTEWKMSMKIPLHSCRNVWLDRNRILKENDRQASSAKVKRQAAYVFFALILSVAQKRKQMQAHFRRMNLLWFVCSLSTLKNTR